MRKRNIDKHIWFSRAEAQELQRKAKKACLSEAGLIRLLIKGYQLAAKANTLGFVDAPLLKSEAEKWNKFQSEIERRYLRPEKSNMKWQ